MTKKEEWVMVPVEPTPEMLQAGIETPVEDCEADDFEKVYRAMLAAAPQSPAAPDVQGEPEETISAVISLVKDAAAAHLNSEFNSCLSKIRKLLAAAPQVPAAPDVWKQAVDNVAGYVHLYSSGYGVIHEIRAEHTRLTATHQKREGE